MEHFVKFQNVSKVYTMGEVKINALHDASFEIERGEVCVIVGPSGAGKTTLFNLLLGFYAPTEGEIAIDNTPLTADNCRRWQQRVGYVSQSLFLTDGTFAENVALGIAPEEIDRKRVKEVLEMAQLGDFVRSLDKGMDTRVGECGCRLSGGQRQRISITRAILKNPPILILDEATSALDTESERLVQEALEKLMRNRTTLVVAHRLSTIRNADLICVVHEGRIVEQGKHDELVAKNGYYKHLVDMQKF